jgi:hypothetical protein
MRPLLLLNLRILGCSKCGLVWEPYPYCISALNSTSILMVGGKEGYLNVFDFNSKKWEENHPGLPVLSNLEYLYSRLSSTITFDKDAKQKLMVLRGKLL